MDEGEETAVGHAVLVIAILMVSAVTAGTTRRYPYKRTQSGSDTQTRSAAL
ncbi:hypothetical protein [Streptomyces sp. NPDC001820]|uniref:hypothetical protein n=1 Tax=Streptomyces sp. NPDC001820 TaxID=3364613 RepID=UPI00369551B9